MPKRVLATSFKAGRTVALLGVTYAKGATIPLAVVARLRRATALISKRIIVPAPAVYGTKRNNDPVRRLKPHPYNITAKERRSLGA